MKRRLILMLIIAVTAMIMAVFGPAAAQDINIDELDNEQLLILLQAITQKLTQGEAGSVPESPEPTPEAPAPTVGPVIQQSAAEPEKFRIYENKKLIVGNMPAAYFVPKSDEGNEPELEKVPIRECTKYCHEICSAGDYVCLRNCRIQCFDGELYR